VRKSIWALVAASVMVMAAAFLCSLPLQPAAQGQQPVIRVSTNLVMVPVNVSDGSGKPVTNLEALDFRIEENGEIQHIETMFEPGKTPLELALLFDISGSVNPRYSFERQAAASFLKKVSIDSLAIVSVGPEPIVTLGRTRSIPEAMQALETLQPTRGMTAFYDAVMLGTRLLQGSAAPDARRVVIVLSDGEDNNSMTAQNDVVRELQRGDCIFYSINPTSQAVLELNAISMKGQQAMYYLAEQTGGVAFITDTTEDLDRIFQQILTDLQAQYVLGYYPWNPAKDGSYRRIVVQVLGHPELRIRARQGYYAPKQ
jgi:Ca-activated chloride channel homolog